MQCPKCGTVAPEGANFCEVDGTRLSPDSEATVAVVSLPAVAVCRCGATAESIDAQGYCQECGRFCGPKERDHIEIVISSVFGGVTDRGKRHTQNEDDMAFSQIEEALPSGQTTQIIVVCDGVSSSEHAEMASRKACLAALSALDQQARTGFVEPEKAMVDAIRAANTAVCALPQTHNSAKDPAETTIVAAVVKAGIATIGWVGDSRAYWFAELGAQQLTHDHSWINDVVDAGDMTEEEASVAPGAHAITRCLGVAQAEDEDGSATQPTVIRFPLPGPGRLLLCSDGLWNYAPHTADIATLLHQAPADADAVTLARTLVDFANTQGGRDNITVVIAQY